MEIEKKKTFASELHQLRDSQSLNGDPSEVARRKSAKDVIIKNKISSRN